MPCIWLQIIGKVIYAHAWINLAGKVLAVDTAAIAIADEIIKFTNKEL